MFELGWAFEHISLIVSVNITVACHRDILCILASNLLYRGVFSTVCFGSFRKSFTYPWLCNVSKNRLRNYSSHILSCQAQKLCIYLDLINTRGFISKTKFLDSSLNSVLKEQIVRYGHNSALKPNKWTRIMSCDDTAVLTLCQGCRCTVLQRCLQKLAC